MTPSPTAPTAPRDAARALLTLLQAITPGRWHIRQSPAQAWDFIVEGERGEGQAYGTQILGDDHYPTKRADAEFIVAARRDLPTLCAALLGSPPTGNEATMTVPEAVELVGRCAGVANPPGLAYLHTQGEIEPSYLRSLAGLALKQTDPACGAPHASAYYHQELQKALAVLALPAIP